MTIKSIFYVILLSALPLLGFQNPEEEVKNNKDIIKFSHQLHIGMETECSSCHANVSESVSLTERLLPEKENCAVCHDVEDEENCNTCHYDEVFEPLVQVEPILIFNHKFHIEKYDLVCESCHNGLDKVDYSFESSSSIPSMAQCFDCHNDETVATNVCESCHIGTADLLPDNHKTVRFFENHKFSALADNNNCAMCHSNEFCEACHVATTGYEVGNTNLDFYTPYSPHRYINNHKQQQLTRVHDLNYRYVHGMDAKSKKVECQSCHQIETFCAECHATEGGDYALGGMVPLSHTKPDFTTLGVGSGGGQHAVLAKRDIENCASCHDVEGSDPNCILCHVDNDGIKGTNPRTHETSFMKSENGDWHNSEGSVCYNCHIVNVKAAGIGFCGYCHGSN